MQLLFLSLLGHAQSVGSRAFDLMLSGLLSESVEQLDVAELQNSKAKPYLLDARERSEFEVSHLNGARWVGYDDFDIKALKDIPKDETILVYCSVGYRSEKIGEQLKEAGYSHVYNLYGGIFEWANNGLPLVNTNNEPTNQVHAYDRIWGVWLDEETVEKVYGP